MTTEALPTTAVTTSLGQVRGSLAAGVHSFKGVPYPRRIVEY